MTGMKVVVTGANGQLGQALLRAVGDCADHVFSFLGKEELDITDGAAVKEALRGAAVVINCAAYTNVEAAEDDKLAADAVNTTGAANLALSAARENALLIHISTDYVFGAEANTPISEDALPHPLNAYGHSKWEGEKAIIGSGCRYIIIRTGWLFSLDGKNFVKTMLRLLAANTELRIVSDQVGTPTFADDLAAVILGIINEPSPTEGIYNYSNEGVCSWYDFAVAIAQLSGSSCAVYPCLSSEYTSKAARPPFSVLDKTKIKTTYNLTISHWNAALQRCMQNYRPE